MKQGQAPVSAEFERSGSAGNGAGRFYMNKIFGRGLEKARALEEQMAEVRKPGTILRAMIEPSREGGGHRVMIERQAMTIQGGQDGENPIRSSEHTFGQIEDAIRFLDDVLHGRLTGENDSNDGNSRNIGTTTRAGANDGKQGDGEADDFSVEQQPGDSVDEW
jgi:hypothetical protein